MNSPPVIDAIRRLAGSGADDMSDTELLGRYVSSKDAQAFDALVRRHGSLVWGACRRRLKDAHAAEDAFQATFLALARHAGTIRCREALGAWLHRTAVRCTAAFRTPRGHMIAAPPETPSRLPDPSAVAATKEIEEVIDSEIDALPEPFRQTFVLCEVQRHTAAEAALTLGCAVGTVESRLTRARQRLKARLGRRGIEVGSLTGLVLLADAVPASARSGAIALASGSFPVSPAMVAIADQSVRVGMLSVIGIGIGVSTSIGLIGLGSIVWALIQGPSEPIPQPEFQRVASRELPIPDPDRFRRNRENFPLPPEAIARVGDPWMKHGAIPTKLAFSGNGKFVATAGPQDRWVRVWDIEHAKPRAHLTLAANETLLAMVLSPDGDSLKAVVRSEKMSLHLREYNTFRALETRRRLLSDLPAESVAFHADGRHLAMAQAGSLQLIDTGPMRQLWKVDSKSTTPVELEFATEGFSLAVLEPGSDRIEIRSVADGHLRHAWDDRGSSLSMPRFNRNGRRLAAWCSDTQQIRVWDVERETLVRSIAAELPMTGIDLAPNGETVVGFMPNRPPRMWSLRTGETPKTGYVSMGGFTGWYSPDGSTLATTTRSGTVLLIDSKTMAAAAASPRDLFSPTPAAFAEDGERLLLEYFQTWVDHPTRGSGLPRDYAPGIGKSEISIRSAGDRSAISPDRKLIARCTKGDRENDEYTIDFLDASTRERRSRIDVGQHARLPAFSQDGKILYASTSDRFIHGWNVATGEEIMCTAEPQTGHVSRLLVSPDGQYLATAQLVFGPGSRHESIRIHDAKTGSLIFRANGVKGEPRIAFSADGRWFAAVVGSERAGTPPTELRVWESATGIERVSLSGYSGQPSFSPDGRTLAVNQDDGIVLIELATFKPRHAFQHHGKVEPAIAWRPDGRVLASSSSEAPVYLWDVAGDRTGNRPYWERQQNDERWRSLVDADPANAFGALRQLWANPSEAVPFLKERMNENADARLAARACEALEMIRSVEAISLLKEWAKRKASSLLAIEATESLKRLEKSY